MRDIHLRIGIERLYVKRKKTAGRPPGGISLAYRRHAVLNDAPERISGPRTELEQRLLAETCELCGSTRNIQVHHVRALKDLYVRGRADKPFWMQIMATRQRKTLVVCHGCHNDSHAGRAPRAVAAN